MAVPTKQYDLAVVCGSAIEADGHLPSFVYEEIDRAAQMVADGIAEELFFSGGFAGRKGSRGADERFLEFNIAREYVQNEHPFLLSADKFDGEGTSTSIPENWLRIKQARPGVKRLSQVVIDTLQPRHAYNAQMVLGDAVMVDFETFPGPPGRFADEWWQLIKTRCILTRQQQRMVPGDHTFLLESDGYTSRWPVLRENHREYCQWAGRAHGAAIAEFGEVAPGH